MKKDDAKQQISNRMSEKNCLLLTVVLQLLNCRVYFVFHTTLCGPVKTFSHVYEKTSPFQLGYSCCATSLVFRW